MKYISPILNFILIFCILSFSSSCISISESNTPLPSTTIQAIQTPAVSIMELPQTAPPVDSMIVYRTETGECYHRDNCSYLKSKIAIPLNDAQRKGLRACSRCNPLKT